MNQDLGPQIHPLNKIILWQTIKKVVFGKMENGVITPERADEILGHVKTELPEIYSATQAKEYYLELPTKYSELSPVTHKFHIEEQEAIDHVLTSLLHLVMDEGDFEGSAKIMERIQNSQDHEKLANELQQEFPHKFQKCIEENRK